MSHSEGSTETVTPIEASVMCLRSEHNELKGVVVLLNDRLRGVEDQVRELSQLIRNNLLNPTPLLPNPPTQPFVPTSPAPLKPPQISISTPPHYHPPSPHHEQPTASSYPPPPPRPNPHPQHATPPPIFVPPQHPPMPPPPSPRPYNEDDRISILSDIGSFEQGRRNERDDDRGLRIDLPEFDGNLNPDAFLDWLSAMERIFEYKGYGEEKRFRVAILKLTGYASLWWENNKKQRVREGKPRVYTWDRLKEVMEHRFLPKEYKQDLYHKLHNLKQEKKTIGEYIREFEQVLIRCDLPESKEHTIARFIGGLNRDVANVVELQPYETLEDVFKLAAKVERQRASLKSMYPKPFTRVEPSAKEVESAQIEPPKSALVDKGKGKAEETPMRGNRNFIPRGDSSRIKCFKCQGIGHYQSNCPNRRVMTLKEWEGLGDTYQVEEPKEEESELEDIVALPDEGDFL